MQVNSTTSYFANTGDQLDATSLSSEVMTQQDFLKLLVAQMTSQNPVEPMDNQDLLGQMVQFSTLQQNTSLQKALTNMQASQDLVQANSLLGRQVTVQVDDDNATQGVVTGISMDSGAPQIVVNGVAYDLAQVTAIAAPTTTSTGTPTPRSLSPISDPTPVTSISTPSVNP